MSKKKFSEDSPVFVDTSISAKAKVLYCMIQESADYYEGANLNSFVEWMKETEPTLRKAIQELKVKGWIVYIQIHKGQTIPQTNFYTTTQDAKDRQPFYEEMGIKYSITFFNERVV